MKMTKNMMKRKNKKMKKYNHKQHSSIVSKMKANFGTEDEEGRQSPKAHIICFPFLFFLHLGFHQYLVDPLDDSDMG